VELLQVVLISVALVVATVALHYEALLLAADVAPKLTIPPRQCILVVLAAAFAAHVLEICLYAFGYYLMEVHLGLGTIGGVREGGMLDYFYFSAAMYTTLGVGDVVPVGPMRLVAAIESLNGFILITWTASFTYLSMERFWETHRSRRRRR
jgi:hypothetical protein